MKIRKNKKGSGTVKCNKHLKWGGGGGGGKRGGRGGGGGGGGGWGEGNPGVKRVGSLRETGEERAGRIPQGGADREK